MVARRQAQHGTGVDPAAEVAPHRNISTKANANRLLESLPELLSVFRIRALWTSIGYAWVVELPILIHLDVVIGCHHIVARGNLKYAMEKCLRLMSAKSASVTSWGPN